MVFPQDFYESITDKMLNAFALHRIILDEEGNPCDYEYIAINSAFEEFTGIKKEDIIGKTYRETIPKGKSDSMDWVCIYGDVAMNEKSISIESYTEAFKKWIMLNAYCPKKEYFITIFSDITSIKNKEQDLKEKNEELSALYEELLASEEELRQQHVQLHHMAYHDPLTSFPNRTSFYENLLVDFERDSNSERALLFIDIDNFRITNDTMGHSFGDQLIMEVGNRLSALFQGDNDIFRLGGDEFIMLGREIRTIREVEECAKRIIQSLRHPFYIMDSTVHITVSIGIARYPNDGKTPDELLKCADIAVYQAKDAGRNKYMIYTDEMQKVVSERMSLEKHLRTAIDRSELELYYQPQVEIGTGQICGFEALLRWNSPELGFVSPLRFIKVAEDSQLIIPIGDWVLRNACFFLKKLHRMGYGYLIMGVNISIIQILQDGFVQTIMNLLDFIQLEPQYLELEITESIFVESYGEINDKLDMLRKRGIKIALDDFGQGYSSLGNLINLPIDTLKIDKIFIDSISSDKSSKSITDMIIQIGHKMELTVLAEGVEMQEQMDYLEKNKCHKIQGYLFSKPVPQKEVLKMLTGKETLVNISDLEWKVEYSVNNDKIDSQHKKMFEMGKRISDMVFANEDMEHTEEILTIIDELKQYTEYHFLLEEEIMKKNGYVHFNTHKTEHEHIVQKLQTLESVWSFDKQNEVLLEMINFVFVWISNHILNQDMKYEGYINQIP